MGLLNDIKAIKKYGFITHVKYLFDLKHTIVNLYINLDLAPKFKPVSFLQIREVDFKNDNILHEWLSIVNDAYQGELNYNLESAKKAFIQHHYLIVTNLYFLYFKDKLVGTYYTGCFKENKKIASGGRIAILKKYQKLGFGKHLILYAFEALKKKGYKIAEFIFYFKREDSIELTFACGCLPQTNEKLKQFKGVRKFFLIKMIAKMKLKLRYNHFVLKNYKPFIK